MTDDEIRQIVRNAIAKHLGPEAAAPDVRPLPPPGHATLSFHRYAVARPADDGLCLIEPAVRCNQCGYCECHGH